MIFLLGFQQLNVQNNYYISAFITSSLLGVFGYYLISVIAEVKTAGNFSSVWWSYVLAGPFGIISSMLIHPRLARKLHEIKTRRKST